MESQFSLEDLVVRFKGNVVVMLNQDLLEQQKTTPEGLERIKKLHLQRVELEAAFTEGLVDAKNYKESWTDIQFQLQEAWGFNQDAKWHRFWDMSGCTCPKMDNDDRYPSGHYCISGDCPVHA